MLSTYWYHFRWLSMVFSLAVALTLGACTGSTTTPAPQATPLPQPTSAPVAQSQPTVRPPTAAPTQAPPTRPAATSTQAPAPTTVPATATTVPATPTRQAVAAAATPACTVGALTPAQTEGPYYKANPPQRASLLEPGMTGVKITLTGYVLTADCKPIPGARVDFWQADAQGVYDNTGYRLRGYQLTDQTGRYTLETVIPGEYPGRTPHIHVKVQAPGQPVLTSQVYFPDSAANARDSIYNPRLLVTMQDTPNGKQGTFNFVLNVR